MSFRHHPDEPILPVFIPRSSGCFLSRPIRYGPTFRSVVILLHQHQTKENMKTNTTLIIALFTLQASLLFAGNESVTLTSTPVEMTLNLTTLVPVTPAEAIFEEIISVGIDFTSLAPVAPVEAEFEEMVPVIDLGSLAPAVPVEADFSDTLNQTIDISSLAPVAPVVADFE
jgi:hypothetical protein